jgi:hypothetical protein
MLTANMKMIAECADKLAHLGEKLFNETEMKKMKIGQTAEFSCPDGYIFKDEHGNIINATKIVLEKKKKEYPKTYEECCKVMNYCCNPVATKTTHKEELIRKFQFLLLYRDAYWKIAGEEMGLGKPWEPNWETLDKKYDIYNYRGVISHDDFTVVDRCVLVFPTEEMRDAFYKNFKDLIEECKELL